MLQLYTWTTPNGIKPLIMLEELAEPYETHWVNIGKGEQFEPSFIAINPNSKIPALVDDGLPIFESGAILVHLAEKFGRFLPNSAPERAQVFEWLFFQVGGVGPMFGQLGHFKHAKESIPYALERYGTETKRLYGVLDKRLAEASYLAGDYSIADMATFGWAAAYPRLEVDIAQFPNVKRWIDQIGERPAVQRAKRLKP
jgi:GSH-dependent disulfide-bond oxidoreductase